MSEELSQVPDNQKSRGAIDVIMGRFVIRPFRRISQEDLYQTNSRFPREGVALPLEEVPTPEKYKEA